MFKDAPIQRKLMTIVLLTTGVALVLTSAALFTFEFINFRKETINRHSALGSVIADNSTAALAFRNKADAEEVLSALAAEPHIVAAALYDNKDKLFATYPINLLPSELPTRLVQEGYRFDESHLSGFQFVIENNRRLGTLFLKSDMSAMYSRFKTYGGLVILVILASLFVAFIFSRKLQSQISRPILSLAEIAKAVSQRKDYSVRAQKLGDDEIGLLTEAFNHMLAQIQEQDKELRENEEKFRLMVWNVQDYAIILLDPSGAVQTWNTGAERLLGYTEKEIVGQHYARFFPTEAVASNEPQYKLNYVTRFGRTEYEGLRLRKDGSLFKANIVLTALWRETGQVRGYCEITRSLNDSNTAATRELDKIQQEIKSTKM